MFKSNLPNSLKQFADKANNIKTYLILANILLVFFLILLNNLGVLPIKNLGNFIFFTFLLLLLALYRPGWSFLFFVGTIALENINVAPAEIGINVRPYQLFAALTIIAVLVRLLVKRLNFELPKWKWINWALVIFAVAGFTSSLSAVDKSMAIKQSVIAASFVAIYFLTRVFIQNLDDLKKVIPFFLSSSVIVILYGIWQNVRFMHGANSFETMPGRPNATFSEADWYGIYLVLTLAVLYSTLYYIKMRFAICNSESGYNAQITNYKLLITPKLVCIFLFTILAFNYVALILTVSRSAWLGALIISIVYQVLCIKYFIIDKKSWKEFFKQLMFLAAAGIISVAIVYLFNLTSFQLFNRFQSTGTGLQKITVSCKEDIILPEKVSYGEELIRYGCRHINLEEIKLEQQMRGYYIKEIYRKDPNVNIRGEIYQKSWNEIKKHPVFGIGWGSIGNILGKDERGTNLNSSNIFLEIWLGAGIPGLLMFAITWFYIPTRAIKKVFSTKNLLSNTSIIFIILSWFALTVPNLFNSGIMLGFLWLFIGISFVNLEESEI